MSQLKSRATVLFESEARLTILIRLRFCFDFLPPDHHGHGSHGHGGHGCGHGLCHRAVATQTETEIRFRGPGESKPNQSKIS